MARVTPIKLAYNKPEVLQAVLVTGFTAAQNSPLLPSGDKTSARTHCIDPQRDGQAE